jgi:hypothetical protein
MSRWILCALMLVASAGRIEAGYIDFSDIKVWVGSGSNQAGFVVDWNNGSTTQSLAWGYRWDGVATGEDMIRAIAAANVGLYATVGYFDGLGYAIFGLGFDANQNGIFGVSPSLTFVNGIATQSRDNEIVDGRTVTDTGDFYAEGWWEGYWSYWVPSSEPNGDWSYSGWGASSRKLEDGTWDGWSFMRFEDGWGEAPETPTPATSPGTASPVPVPAGWILLLTATPILAFTRRKRTMTTA